MRNYATAQNIGTRTHQCDATAVRTNRATGARAYVLLDGIGSNDTVRTWTRNAATRLARAAAHRGDAEAGLRAVYEAYAAERADADPWATRPKAAAIVAVTAPNRPLTIAWCGDSRAYVLTPITPRRLTRDHNKRRVDPPSRENPCGGNRNVITSSLGSTASDQDVKDLDGHPAIESTNFWTIAPTRLLLASDGAYEPHEEAGHSFSEHLIGHPSEAARHFVDTAVRHATTTTHNVDPNRPTADNATALIAELWV